MQSLRETIGRERALAELTQTLYFEVRARNAALVGALHVTCADESEAECADAFQHGFVQYVVPPLKFDRRSAFRIANLGGRYEWGAARQADRNYALAPSPAGRSRLLVVKINAHVAVEEVEARQGGIPTEDGTRAFRLGVWRRYGHESLCCAALHGLLNGEGGPAIGELRERFTSEGYDRIAALTTPEAAAQGYAPLHAAIVSARLQARTAVLDLQDHAPATPTEYLVLPCVTLNRHERNTELLCGIYTVDARSADRTVTYVGLGDDPAAYRVRLRNRQLQVSDDQLPVERPARDHRAVVRSEWQSRRKGARPRAGDPRLERISEDVARNRHRDHHHARLLLRAALPVLAEVMPVPAAVLLFAEGAAGMHHAYRVHRIARDLAGTEEAKAILADVHDRVDRLSPEKAEALIELLVREYQR